MAILSTSTLTFIDLNEISIGDEPNNPTNNQIWFDTSTNTVKKWNSLTTSWEVVNDYTEDIKDAIRNLNISGRNLLANTAYSKELSGTGGTNQTGCKYNLVNTITYEKDIKEKEITLAFDWEFTGSIAAGSFIAQTAGPLYTPLSEVINISSNNYYGTSVFTTILTDTKSFSAVEIKASGINGIIRVTHPRLFYGSKDLDWSPAPEDTAAQFETIFDRTAKGIYMSVSDLEANKKSLVDINNNAVVIKSDSINLEGLVTANNNFKVLLDGSIEAVNGKFSGIIQADTEITSPKISGGTINGTSLTVGDNFSVDGTTGKLTAKDGSFHGTIEADSDIQGATFTSKNGYFKVLADGTIESTGGKFTGNVTSNLAISGATITGSTIETKSKKFKVDNNGILTATEAKISGTITSSEISSTTIKAGNNNEFLVSTDGSVSASNLTISGGSINLGNNTFKVDNTGKVTASDVSITGGTLSIGDKFLVSNTGVLTAIDGNFKGNIQADSTITGASFASKNNTLTIDVDGNLVSEGTISLANGNFYVNDQGQLSLTGSINAGSSITGATITGGTIGTKNGNFYVNSDGILTAKGAIIEGDVRITSGSVPSSVLPNDIVNGAANGTSANEKIDNLQIGGTNLWVLSDLITGHETSGNITANTGSVHKMRQTLVDVSDTNYITYQIWNPDGIVNNANTNRIAWYDSEKTYISSVAVPKLNGSYQTAKYTRPSNAKYVRLSAVVGDTSINENIKIKYEKGDKPTDWTPAPEDVDSAITNVDNKFANYSTTTEMNSAITQKANEITSSVSNTYATKSTVNSLSDNLTKNYSTTSQMNSAINQKANEITSTVSNTYATKTTVNDLSNNLAKNYSTTSQMNSAINQKANEITSTVSSTYTTKNDFNNLSIGGSNLLKNTRTLDTVYGRGQNKWAVSDTGTEGFKQLETSTTNTNWVECQIPLYTEYNGLRQNVTISFQYYEGVSELLVFSFSAHKADGTRVKEIANTVVKTTFKDLGLRDGWSYVSYTFDPTSVNFQSGADHYCVQFKKNEGKTGKISIRKIKLEYGNKATDWSPAPKDIDNAITTVNNKFDNYSTTTEMNSAITQKANEITTSVSSTYTTKTDFNNLTIGGRNLAQKTSSDYSPSFSISSDKTTFSVSKVLTDGLAVGDTVTVRLIYKYTDIVPVDGQTATWRLQGNGDVTSYSSGKFKSSARKPISGSGEHIIEYNFTITEDHLLNSYWQTSLKHEYVQSGSITWKMFKVEKGNKATDWTPAPEDMEDYTNTIANNLNNTFNSNISSSINKAKTDTLNEVADKYVTNKDYEEFKTMTSSSIEQTSNDVTIKFNTTTQNIQSIGGELTQFKESVQTNIKLHDDGISIGKTDNPFSVDITNQKMSFKDQGIEVAYISNQEMRITDAIIENALTLGNFKFIPRLTGNVSLIWDDMGNMCYYDTSYCNMTNDSYPTANVYFREKPVPGELYTIEICASLGPGLNYWGIYNTNGSVSVNLVEYWRFAAGIAKKSFIWVDSNTYPDGNVYTGDNTFMQLYAMPYIPEGRPASTVTYAKLFKGDALWKDNGNLLRFNNIFDYPTGTTNAGLRLDATKDDYYIYTEMYCYLETGVEYKFSCEVDGGEGNWGGSSSDDTVQAFLMNQDDPDAWIYKEINPTSTFTVDVSTRYWLRLDVNKNGCTHWFSNIWITKV